MLRQVLRGGNAVLTGNGWVEEWMRAALGAREVLRGLLRWPGRLDAVFGCQIA